MEQNTPVRPEQKPIPSWGKLYHQTTGILPVLYVLIGLACGAMVFVTNALWATPFAVIAVGFLVGAPIIASLRRIEIYTHEVVKRDD